MLKHLQSSAEWDSKSVSAKGFTLIELLVVVIILGILAAVAVFAVGNLTDNAKVNTCKTEHATVKTAVQAYIAKDPNQAKPTAITDLDESNGGNLDAATKYWTINNTGAVVAKSGVTIPSGCP